MEKIIAGYRKFKDEVYPEQRHRFKSLAQAQAPKVLFITCADSRIDPSLITQAEPGELFICRVVGNLVPSYGSGNSGGVTSAVEYAVAALGVEHIVVCGHSDCGAMRAFSHPEKLEGLPAVKGWLSHAETAIAVTRDHFHGAEPEGHLEFLTKENALLQIEHLKTHPSVAPRLRRGKLHLHAWYYNIGPGVVEEYDSAREQYVELGAAVGGVESPELVLAG